MADVPDYTGEAARACLADGWTSAALREAGLPGPLDAGEVADRMAEIEQEEDSRG